MTADVTDAEQYEIFQCAVQALDAGDIERLEMLLDEHPWLVRYQCRKGELYEEGYFAGATLLHHVAGNPDRCPIPSNIVDITRLLLSRGARDEPPRPRYTIGLLLTSRQASASGVAIPLIDLLGSTTGVELDLTDPNVLDGPLGNGAPATALELIRRGAKISIRHAAALGRLDLVENLFAEADRVQREVAFIRACTHGHNMICEFLLDHGVDPAAQATVGQTGLHYAAHSGQLEIVKMLIARNAPLEVKNMYRGTVLGQALWSALNEPHKNHPAIVEALIAAGAKVDPEWNKWIAQVRARDSEEFPAK
jgi:hypothetical protein